MDEGCRNAIEGQSFTGCRIDPNRGPVRCCWWASPDFSGKSAGWKIYWSQCNTLAIRRKKLVLLKIQIKSMKGEFRDQILLFWIHLMKWVKESKIANQRPLKAFWMIKPNNGTWWSSFLLVLWGLPTACWTQPRSIMLGRLTMCLDRLVILKLLSSSSLFCLDFWCLAGLRHGKPQVCHIKNILLYWLYVLHFWLSLRTYTPEWFSKGNNFMVCYLIAHLGVGILTLVTMLLITQDFRSLHFPRTMDKLLMVYSNLGFFYSENLMLWEKIFFPFW